jgi:hypothetical protein
MSGLKFDVENQMSDEQAFTGALTVSQNSYKKQTAAQDISIGRRMALLVLPVPGTVEADPAATHTIQAIQADDAALTVNVEVIGESVVLGAELAYGKEVEVPIRQGSMSRQYLGAQHSAVGGAAQTATLDIYLVPQDEIAEFKTFPKINDAIVS